MTEGVGEGGERSTRGQNGITCHHDSNGMLHDAPTRDISSTAVERER